MRIDGDRGDVVLGWLTKLTVTLAVVGLVGFDAISLAAARFSAEDRAQSAARVAVDSYAANRDLQKAYDAALAEVAGSGDTLDAPAFTAGADGSITLRLRKQVPTLLVDRVGPVRDWATVTRTVTARPSS